MKQMNKLVVLAAFAIAATSCNKAAERPAQNDKSIAGVMEVSKITEVTTESKDPKAPVKGLYVKEKTAEIDALGYGLKQVAIADESDTILKKVTKMDTKKVLDEQLKDGPVGFVIVKGADGKPVIKVMRVVPDTTLSNKYNGDILSLKYMRGLKDYSKAVDAKAQSDISTSLRAWRYKNPADFGEKFGLVEITSIKIKKMGILENLRTEYGEKRSVMGLTEKPMGEATHILVGDEEGSEEEAAAQAEEAKAAAQTN
ncbi:MAG: hypothetical protein K2P92_09220 [Bdellovibrionaceae bacterium]|nr:hypothetical protein [Pseudobdellovibrionaceae bacterium]